MPIMLAGFLTNAAVANMAFRFRNGRRFFDISKMIAYEKVFEWFNSPTLGMLEPSGSPDSVVTEAFRYEMLAPLMAIILCQQGLTGHAHNASEDIVWKPQDYITPIEGARDYVGRVSAEMKVLDSLLTSIKQFPHCPGSRHKDYVMGFHPFIPMPDLHNFVGPIPTSATFVLRLIVESYKSWYTLPIGMQRVPEARLCLHALKFAQNVHNTVVRFRLSKPYEPTVGCECSACCGPGLMEDLRMFESELSKFTKERKFDLYHQSPVVAGYQMTRILARATVLGILFCNIRQYVGVVLHLYNFLRQYDLIDEERILLEHLYDVMGHNIFRGPRPTHKFYSHYAAFQAMTLKFNHKSRTFSFGESNIHQRQFDSHSLSVMTGLNECRCQPYCNRWGTVWRGIDKRSRVTNEGIFKFVDQIASHPLVCVLEPLESVVRSEWEGKFPVARINWFEVFTACTDILEKMPAVHCEDPKDLTSRHFHSTRDDDFCCGKNNVEYLLAEAQQLEQSAFKIACAERLRLAVDAIRETLKGEAASAVKNLIFSTLTSE